VEFSEEFIWKDGWAGKRIVRIAPTLIDLLALPEFNSAQGVIEITLPQSPIPRYYLMMKS
jgi:hypothetical protein